MLSLKFKTINPTTEEILNEYENMSYENIDKTVKKANLSALKNENNPGHYRLFSVFIWVR